MVESIKELRKICCKSKAENPYIQNYLRVMSIYFTKLFLYTSITPNQITILGMVNTLLATILFIFGNYWMSLIASVLVLFSFILDCCDGEVSRYRKESSMKGAYLDDIGYYLIEAMPFIGITLGIFRNTNNFTILIFGFSAVFFIVMTRLSDFRRFVFVVEENIKNLKKNKEQLFKFIQTNAKTKTNISQDKKPENFPILNFIRKLYKNFFHLFLSLYGIINLIMTAALLNRLDYLIYLYGAILPLFFCFNVIYQLLRGFDLFYLNKTKQLYNFKIKNKK